MEDKSNYEAAAREMRRLCAVMARSSTDSTEMRIAKEAFRLSVMVAAASVVAVIVRSTNSELAEVGRAGES